ncbi:MAG: aminoglycoside phosphotransferase family protein [Deltaproteobacteria bacterium]|nr:aminoglycoside phosphotransferase family protein [Deltaproteobacteria bacterium]
MRTIILIPTSRFVDAEMQLDVGRIPPALIPVRARPLYRSIIDQYQSLPGTIEFALSVCEGKDLLQASVDSAHLKNVSLLEIPRLPDLGAAVLNTLEQMDLTTCDNLFLNFGDTIIDAALDLTTDTIFFEDISESFRWTTFEYAAGKITNITDKGIIDDSKPRHVFTGVFLIKKPLEFLEHLRTEKPCEGLGLFYSALMNYLSVREYRLQRVKEWHDFGHVDNYYHERKKSLNKRFFNQVSIDTHRPMLTKKSEQTEKFIGEIAWYLEIPTALKPYVPQVFDYSLDKQNPFLKMEFYGYPTVGELLLSGGHNLGIWNHVFDAIFATIREMQSHHSTPPAGSLPAALKEMYVAKTIRRMEQVRQHPILSRFFKRDVVINKRHYPCLNEIIADLQSHWQSLVPSRQTLSVIHGDLCASNILFDPRSRIIKLIDPRGQFGDFTIYGDYRYDLAKLSHSFNGHYEMIINDSFFAVCEENSISYSISTSAYQDCVASMFNQRMSSLYPQDQETVRMLESILFLSMLPLHSDHLNRQIVMLATGLQKYTMASQGFEART